jgi:spoIIIJ-associated protein
MSQNKHSIEINGSDIEKAVEAGLRKLGLNRSEVLVEVIDEGSRGLLGLGSRDAIVRITKIGSERVEEVAPPVVEKKTAVVPPKPKPTPSQPAPAKPQPQPISKPAPPVAKVETPKNSTSQVTNAITPEEIAAEQEMAIAIIGDMLQKMEIAAEVSASLTEPDDLTGNQMIVIDLKGEDLGALIGPRGETLSSLQYITRLMVGHKLRRRANFVVDVENYRQRREQALARLAERMADKVVKRGRPVGLEPMPPHERRIIHMTLRENASVYTQSIGEGNRRKVRIMPK